MIILTLVAIIIAYLIGSINSAIIVSKITGMPDPRTSGSGNPGATNMLRLGGKNTALMVLVADAVKGLLAVLIGKILAAHGAGLGFVALAAVVGHVFPVFFKFQGGKGVATAFGALLGLSLLIFIFVGLIWFIIVLITKYVSLASIVAVAAMPILMFITGNMGYAFPLLIMALLIIWQHKENIDRLKTGSEPPFSWK